MAFEELQAMLDQVRNQKPIRRTNCPKCGWALTDGPRGLHCPFGCWQEYIIAPRIQRDERLQ